MFSHQSERARVWRNERSRYFVHTPYSKEHGTHQGVVVVEVEGLNEVLGELHSAHRVA